MEMYIGGNRVYPLDVSYNKSMSHLGASVKTNFPISDIEANVSTELGQSLTINDNGVSRFQGMITALSTDSRKLSVTAHDGCYPLNKSKTTIQFNDENVSEAIKALFQQIGVSVRYIPSLEAKVSTTFFAQPPAEIAKKLLQEEQDINGGEYYITSEERNAVEIRAVGSLSCDASLSHFISPSRSITLDDVKNRISILVSDGDGYTVAESASDNTSIRKYGLFQEYIKISSDASTAVVTAQNKLALSRFPVQEGTVTVEGNWNLSGVGWRIPIYDELTGFEGNYIITAVSHKLGDDFKTTLTLREAVNTSSFKEIIAK